MTLHVYAQTQEHDEAHIIGTREDLVRLRAANSIGRSLGRGGELPSLVPTE